MIDTPVIAKAANLTDAITILMVEDDVMVRATLSDGLRDAGYTVIDVVNADEAVAVLRNHIRVDVVVTDMQMPGAMDGAALVHLLRAGYPFLKVVMMCGQPPDDATLGRLHGYLPKPVTPSRLSSYLRELMVAS